MVVKAASARVSCGQKRLCCWLYTPEDDDGDCTTDILCSVCDAMTTKGNEAHTGGTATCTAKAECSVCGTKYSEMLKHTYTVPQSDEADHWNKCKDCDAIDTKIKHSGDDDGDCTTAVTCSCSYILIAAQAHSFDNACDTDCNNTDCMHTRTIEHTPVEDDGNCLTEVRCAICNVITTAAHNAHTGGVATCTAKAACANCGTAYGELNATNHTATAEWTQTAMSHAKAYTCCSAVVVAEEAHAWENGICSECGYGCEHTGGTATCIGKAVCTGCGHEYGEKDADNHASNEFTYTANSNGTHKKAHACCGVEVTASENCAYGNDRICDLCGYERPRPVSPSAPADTSKPDPNSPTVDTDTTVNQDGSVTVTETKKDGTVVETTTGADGSTITAASKTEEKETYKGTTITTTTETKTESADGTTVTEKTVVQTVVDKKGNETTTSKTETKMDNGATGTTIVAADGTVSAEVKITSTAVNEAVKSDEPVVLPMPAVEAESAIVEIGLPRNSDDVTVAVPVVDLTAGTVAVLVKADGTEEVIRKSVADGDALIVPLDDSATIKVVDAAKEFTDTVDHWAEDAIDFASSHELYQGTSSTEFSPNGLMTRAMLMTVMARLDGQNTDSGAAWYTAGMEWAVEMGISDGSSPMQNISREQMVTMLYRYAKSIGCDVSVGEDTNILSYNDALAISDYAFAAMQWACGEGIITGHPGGILAPDGNATRAEVATIIRRFVILLTK